MRRKPAGPAICEPWSPALMAHTLKQRRTETALPLFSCFRFEIEPKSYLTFGPLLQCPRGRLRAGRCPQAGRLLDEIGNSGDIVQRVHRQALTVGPMIRRNGDDARIGVGKRRPFAPPT